MKNFVSAQRAGDLLLMVFGLLFVFHMLILLGLVPYDIVWAGRLKSQAEMIKFESMSIVILAICASIVGLKLRYLKFIKSNKLINASVWLLVVLFLLNTVGNTTAANDFEKYFFGTLTLILTLLSFRLAIEP